MRLTQITEEMLSAHYFLDRSDDCYVFCEYTAQAGYLCGDCNQLILNYKKKMDKKGNPEWRYKEQAINTVTRLIHNAVGDQSSVLFVPIPPSKAKNDILYDDRNLRALMGLNHPIYNRKHVYVKELVLQKYSMEASHEQPAGARPTILDLSNNYILNDQEGINPTVIIVFDDMLTTGRHFKAMKQFLNYHYPNAKIFGLFIARRGVAN